MTGDTFSACKVDPRLQCQSHLGTKRRNESNIKSLSMAKGVHFDPLSVQRLLVLPSEIDACSVQVDELFRERQIRLQMYIGV